MESAISSGVTAPMSRPAGRAQRPTVASDRCPWPQALRATPRPCGASRRRRRGGGSRERCRERRLVPRALGGDDDVALACAAAGEVVAGDGDVDLGKLSRAPRPGRRRRRGSRAFCPGPPARRRRGVAPHTSSSGCGSTGSTNTSMVPWLGHMFRANSMPPCLGRPRHQAPAARRPAAPRPGAAGRRSSAARAASRTAARAQPPPIQPADMVPSLRIRALAPALAAVSATVRTTVATAKGSPDAFSALSRPARRPACSWSRGPLEARQIGLERRQRPQVVRRGEQIDERQGRLHAPRARLVAVPADHRVEPHDALGSAAPVGASHRP